MKKIYRDLIISSAVIATSATVIIPVAITQTNQYKNISIQNNSSNKKYKLGDKVFDSKPELMQYAKVVANKKDRTVDINEVWTINDNNETKFFNNPNSLLNYLESKIKKISVNHSEPLDLGVDGELLESNFNKLSLNNPNSASQTMTIYRGKNNQAFKTELEAKESYLTSHDAYYFDGIYFRTTEELKSYINKNQKKYLNQVVDSNNNFVIQAPNGYYSKTLNFNELQTPETQQYIKGFITANAKRYLELKGNDQMYRYYDKEDIRNDPSAVISNVDRFSYVKLDENSGKSNYIVDLDIDDKYNLYGPYYVQSSDTITQMKNPNNWAKVDKVDTKFATNQIVSNIISNFLSFLLTDYTEENSDHLVDGVWYPFLFSGLEDEQKQYFKKIKEQYPIAYDELKSLLDKIRRGKRYNSFLKIPICFINIIENLITLKADQYMIDETKQVFNNIAKQLDSNLLYLFPKEILLRNNTKLEHNNLFSFEELFSFKSTNFNLNTDIESYTDIIRADYTSFFNTINFMSNIMMLNSKTFGIIEPDFDVYKKLFVNDNSTKNGVNMPVSWKLDELYEKYWRSLNSSDIQQIDSIYTEIARHNGINVVSTLNKLPMLFYKNASYNISGMNATIDYIKSIKLDTIVNKYYNDNEEFAYKLLDLQITNIQKWISEKSKTNKEILREFFAIKICNSSSAFGGGWPIEYCLKNTNLQPQDIFQVIDVTKWLFPNMKSVSLNDINYVENNNGSFGQTVAKIATTAVNLFNKALSFVSNCYDTRAANLQLANNVLTDVVMKGLKVIPAIGIALTVIDLIASIIDFKVKDSNYVFESENVKYVWDGGHELTLFFGLLTLPSSTTIKDMKLISPIEVNKKQTRDQYYYNSKIYDDLNELKIQQVNDIINGLYQNDSIKLVYSFDRVNKSYSKRPDNVFQNEEELLNYTNMLINNRDPRLIKQNIYKYAGGYTFDSNLAFENNVVEITKNIKQSRIIPLPVLVDNKPIYSDNTLDDNSIPKYSLPGKYWTPLSGLVTPKENNEKNYIIYNPNIDKSSTSGKSTFEDCVKQFYNSFDVQTKTILTADYNSKNMFSSYSDNYLTTDLYYAVNEMNEVKIFTSKNEILNWLLKQKEYKTYSRTHKSTTYTLADKQFYNFEDYFNWILSYVKEV